MKTIRKAELKWARVPMAAEEPETYGKRVACARDVHRVAKALIADEVQEVIVTFFLNQKNRVIGYQEVAKGALNACSVAPADIFRGAIMAGATAIIVAHNHPSGEPTPSDEDRRLTTRIVRAGELLGVRVLDHVVVAEEGYFSFCDAGLMGVANA